MKMIVLGLAVLAATTGAAAQSAPTPGHMAAAIELVETMQMETTLRESLETTLQMQLEANPQLRSMEALLRDFFARYMSWDALREDYARLYADAFTEDELRQLTVFYRSPLGQKVASTTPQLMARAGALGEKVVQDHLPELQQMIIEHMQQGSGNGDS